MSGADLIDGTPVLDIKPYVAYADAPSPQADVRQPEWVQAGGAPRLRVEVTEQARADLRAACGAAPPSLPPPPPPPRPAAVAAASAAAASASSVAAAAPAALRFFAGAPREAEAAIVQVLQADPRSVYRKQKCAGQLYRVCVDGLDAACRFGEEGSGEQPTSVTVESVRLLAEDAQHGDADAQHGDAEHGEGADPAAA